MSDFLQSLTEYTASLEQRLSALESALSVLQTQWTMAQTKEKEQEAIIASLAAKNSMLQSCISAHEERIAALEKAFADGEWAEIPEEISTEAAEESPAEELVAEAEEPIAEETVAAEELPDEEEVFVEQETAAEPEEEELPAVEVLPADEEKVPAESVAEEEKVEAESVAPKANLYGKPVDDIKQAIALGDRFLFQRELFRQNVELMQRTFADINALHSFNEAIAYLDKRFDWDKESNTYALFLTALHRRFS
ncbi:MAG: hypothetical protein SOT07_02470 [Paludibacteraceae bacterium]|nr:hypothetical protein [Paludibacteraceae bacterium]